MMTLIIIHFVYTAIGTKKLVLRNRGQR